MSILCENCGKEIADNKDLVIFVKNGEGMNFFCRKCNELFGTCYMCQNTTCGFFDDPDPMPQFVVVAHKIQQGNATFIEQKQVPNPERVKRFCTDGKCKCFLDDFEHPLCCRHGGYITCTNYCEKEKHNFAQDFPMQKANEN